MPPMIAQSQPYHPVVHYSHETAEDLADGFYLLEHKPGCEPAVIGWLVNETYAKFIARAANHLRAVIELPATVRYRLAGRPTGPALN